MKYRMINKVFGLKTDRKLNKGIKISDRKRFTNCSNEIDKNFSSEYFKYAIGSLNFEDLKNDSFIYEYGDIENTDETMRYLNNFLARNQIFISCLWLVKDNSVNIENGYIYLIENGRDYRVSSNSRMVKFSNSKGNQEDVVFSDEELSEAVSIYNMIYLPEISENYNDYLLDNIGFRSNRIELFLYNLQLTRNESYIPSKIAMYATLFETLLSTDSSTIGHKMAERVALMLEEEYENRLKIFKTVKQMYTIRSSVFHGDKLKKEFDKWDYCKFEDFSYEVDQIIRKLIRKIIENDKLNKMFSEDDTQALNKYFNELIFKGSNM